jgi:hypothetical protein
MLFIFKCILNFGEGQPFLMEAAWIWSSADRM